VFPDLSLTSLHRQRYPGSPGADREKNKEDLMEPTRLKVQTEETQDFGDPGPEESRQVRDQFFRVSKVVGSARLLDGWVEWFKARNIPCAITKAGRGYSLWRSGVEIGGGVSIALSALIQKNIVASFGLTPADEAGSPG
jgi:hypothetical protein